MAAAKKTNWFAIWVSAAVVVVLVAVGGLVVWMNQAATDPGETPTSGGINQETGAIIVGDGPAVLDTYIDFMCPICGQFEDLYGETILEQVDAGEITLNIHPISILDRASQGTQFSTRAASAMYCVAEESPDDAVAFMQQMFVKQPAEGTEGLTDSEIVDIAKGVGAEAAADCIADGTFTDFVSAMTGKTPVREGAAGIGTPTVVLDGEILTLTGDPAADLTARLK